MRLKAGVVVSGREDAWYVTDLGTGTAYEANATSVRVVEAVRAGADEAGCVRALREAYPDVPREEVERDVRALLAWLRAQGLVEGAP